ncbi:hypothetical protein LCGC14_1363020 [marine sediment metagenome]|uniref:Uncharacterized protein n=1 Tax=marine sediment metagenome TaxID=412755 RepID=A0A0F9K844_9ZZZZ
MYRLLFLIPLALLFLACDSAEPVVTNWVVREVVREVPVEVIVEVPVEVPVEVIEEIVVEVPVAPANCPPSSEVDWLIWSLEDARAMHQAWADFLHDNPLADGSGLIENAVGSSEEQLEMVATYDRRLSIVAQLKEACK